ncbi:MAG: DUF1934 domain-containing protein [Bacillota bacterium]|nr:DUF1934 domain-containing protein [Bacillota bacterium]
MSKRALISIVSKQRSKDEEAIEVKTPGSFSKDDYIYRAIYDETEISGMEGTTTTLEIEPDKFVLIREGSTSTRMEFMKDNRYTTLYNTPYGPLELIILTKDLKVNVNDKGGEVYVNYDMSVSGQTPQKTELKIDIKA